MRERERASGLNHKDRRATGRREREKEGDRRWSVGDGETKRRRNKVKEGDDIC